MAEKTLKTRIALRHDETANWTNQVLAKGEVGFEFTTEGKKKMKVGDGVTAWESLDYFGAPGAQVFEVIPNTDETDSDAIARVVGTVELAEGDIAYVKRTIAEGKYSYTAYVYNGTVWAAMDGNYSAENVYFAEDLVYTAPIGVKTVPASGSGTINAQGKNVKEVLASILAEEKNPSITQPSASLTSSNIGSKEVGTNISVAYQISTNAGTYQYGPATGVTFSDYTATFNGETLNGNSGIFTSIQVTDDTNLTITGSVHSSAGAVPKTNLGNNYAEGAIVAKDHNLSKGTLTGFRGWFYGYKNGDNAIDAVNITSDQVRGLGSGAKTSIPSQMETSQMKQMFFAIPKGKKTSITVADATNGAPQTVTKITDVMVEGANGYTATAYDVWYVDNAAAASGSAKFNITVK